ncbi:preprotein translocase subunit SecG [Candidatus Nomurabacteria bacterium]|uniref:Protein-export membrane protein SecG n=1 Tax=Candidatus Dojkabacteria bacterium TaxID=2099670 RepID=A0A955KX56_9BACT|nr:preprotein translocase subunit SecG [Candidatus Dojkabacteria bacterium]MCB9789950.1 preprotein translocase subunit SecG [Candidatus Nomurabacteria bacterium]MCB9803424.1 preprotein translocase subunit SecG [Candidatus Nomurabacteria bacterium]
MDTVSQVLMISEVIVVIGLVISILLQSGDEGLSGMFGGGGGETFRTKRGLERFMYYTTIILGVVFAVLSFLIVKFGQ